MPWERPRHSDQGGWTSARVPASAGLKTGAARAMGLSARPPPSGLTRSYLLPLRAQSSPPSVRRSRCVELSHVSSSPLTGYPCLSFPTCPPLEGWRPSHGSRCPLEADHSEGPGPSLRQSEDVKPHRLTVSSKTQYLCARTGAQGYRSGSCSHPGVPAIPGWSGCQSQPPGGASQRSGAGYDSLPA